MRAATPATTAKTTTKPACKNERAAAEALGYDQQSWDNPDNTDIQPISFEKEWDELSPKEKEAVTFLGASSNKEWSKLATTCGECPDTSADMYGIVVLTSITGVYRFFLIYSIVVSVSANRGQV